MVYDTKNQEFYANLNGANPNFLFPKLVEILQFKVRTIKFELFNFTPSGVGLKGVVSCNIDPCVKKYYLMPHSKFTNFVAPQVISRSTYLKFKSIYQKILFFSEGNNASEVYFLHYV